MERRRTEEVQTGNQMGERQTEERQIEERQTAERQAEGGLSEGLESLRPESNWSKRSPPLSFPKKLL